MKDFILATQLAKQGKYSKNTLYVTYAGDKQKGRTDRFKKVGSRLWVHKDYPNPYITDIIDTRNLYYKVSRYFNNLQAMAKYFHKSIGVTSINMYNYLQEARFYNNERRARFKLLLEEFLQLKQTKGRRDGRNNR